MGKEKLTEKDLTYIFALERTSNKGVIIFIGVVFFLSILEHIFGFLQSGRYGSDLKEIYKAYEYMQILFWSVLGVAIVHRWFEQNRMKRIIDKLIE